MHKIIPKNVRPQMVFMVVKGVNYYSIVNSWGEEYSNKCVTYDELSILEDGEKTYNLTGVHKT